MDERISLYSFDNYIERHEIQESLDKRDDVRYSSAIYDTANRKISSYSYGVDVKMSRPSTSSGIGGRRNNFHNSLVELEDGSQSVIHEIDEANKERMISAGFEYANSAKDAEDPLEYYHLAGRLFDKAEIYDKAIKYYLKAIRPTDPVEIVDTKQLPMTQLEKRKLERMGKMQKARYLKEREEKRRLLIEKEEAKQERRIQDSHCRLFRIFLYQAIHLVAPTISNEKVSYGSQKEQRVYEHHKNDLLTKSHAHLRAAFRAIHPARPAAYAAILKYADLILSSYLPPSSPEDGIYLHAASGSAGQLQEGHILILQELLTLDDRDTGSLEQLGRRFAEKCDFENARIFFKKARDVHEANRTPRYASSIPLVRHQGVDYDLLNQNKEMSTTMVPPNTTSTAIGTTLNRTHLFEGKKLAMVKIPMQAFGEGNLEDAVMKRELSDYTSFGGCHEGSETRVFLPPSIGWKKQLQIVDKVNQEMSHVTTKTSPQSPVRSSSSQMPPILPGSQSTVKRLTIRNG